MKKIIAFLMAAVLMLTCFAACGKNEGDGTGSETSGTSAAQGSAAEGTTAAQEKPGTTATTTAKDLKSDVTGLYTVKTINGMSFEEYLMDGLKKQLGEQAETMDINDLLKSAGYDSLDDIITVELKDDGTAIMKSEGETQEGTWELKGEKIKITVDGEAEECSFKNGELTLQVDDEEMILAKK